MPAGLEEVQQHCWLLSCPQLGLSGQEKDGFPSAELRKSREGAPLSRGGFTRQLKSWAVIVKIPLLAPGPSAAVLGVSPGGLQELLGALQGLCPRGWPPAAANTLLCLSLSPRCDADPSALANYVVALVKKDKPEKELKAFCADQLDVFLQKGLVATAAWGLQLLLGGGRVIYCLQNLSWWL